MYSVQPYLCALCTAELLRRSAAVHSAQHSIEGTNEEINFLEKSENMEEVHDKVFKNVGANLKLSKIKNIDNTSGDTRFFACQLCNYKEI